MDIKNKIIGGTPIIKINYKYNGKINYIYAKLEYYNLTGSIKDRAALYMITEAKKRGELKENMPIVEATSGNTGISLAALGHKYNHQVNIFMTDSVSKERVDLLKGYGANVFLNAKEDGGFNRSIKNAQEFATLHNGYYINQFENIDNYLAHYYTTGVEILEQVKEKIGGFVSGVGTGGTLMGTGTRLKEKYDDIKITAVEPDKAPVLSKKEVKGIHKIEGIGNSFIPKIVDIDKIDKVILINDNDAINMTRKISKKLGIGVGISSGSNMLGSVLLKDEIDNAVVTIFADDNKKYLSTELFESNNNINYLDYISNKIELIDYEEV